MIRWNIIKMNKKEAREIMNRIIKHDIVEIGFFFKNSLGVPNEYYIEWLKCQKTKGDQLRFIHKFGGNHPKQRGGLWLFGGMTVDSKEKIKL